MNLDYQTTCRYSVNKPTRDNTYIPKMNFIDIYFKFQSHFHSAEPFHKANITNIHFNFTL